MHDCWDVNDSRIVPEQPHRWQPGLHGSPVLTTIPKTSSSVALSAHVCSTISALAWNIVLLVLTIM